MTVNPGEILHAGPLEGGVHTAEWGWVAGGVLGYLVVRPAIGASSELLDDVAARTNIALEHWLGSDPAPGDGTSSPGTSGTVFQMENTYFGAQADSANHDSGVVSTDSLPEPEDLKENDRATVAAGLLLRAADAALSTAGLRRLLASELGAPRK